MSQSSIEIRSDQLAPHSIEAEQAVIGSILLDPYTLDEADTLTAEMFFLVRHGLIWEAMQNLRERREPVDHLTIVSELEQMGKIADVGGAAYIISLINKTPSALNVQGYVAIVERMYERRILIEAAQEVARVAHSDETDIDEVKRKAEESVLKVTRRGAGVSLVMMDSIVSKQYDNTIEMMKPDGKRPDVVPTHLTDLTAMLGGGFRNNDLITIGARPGMGKTSLILDLVIAEALRGNAVGVISYEMDREALGYRVTSKLSGIPFQTIQNGAIRPELIGDYTRAVDEAASYRVIVMDDVTKNSPRDVRRIVGEMVREHGVTMVVVDYIGLMGSPGHENRVQEISDISRNMKLTAREFHIPIIQLSQLSRAVEQRQDKRPMLSDLRESGSLEQDSDVVMFIYRDAYYDPFTSEGLKAELIVAKHRNGRTGTVDAVFIPESMRFANAASTNVDLNKDTDESLKKRRAERGPIPSWQDTDREDDPIL